MVFKAAQACALSELRPNDPDTLFFAVYKLVW